MNHAILVLQVPFGEDKFAARDHEPVAFVQVRSDDHVGDAGFVFHRDEDKTMCCAGPLSGDNASGSSDESAMRMFLQLFSGEHPLSPQFLSAIRHGMLANGKPGSGVIGDQTLFVVICCSGMA